MYFVYPIASFPGVALALSARAPLVRARSVVA
jgi:hypothetical protein